MQEFCLRQRASTSVEDSRQIQCYSKVGGWVALGWVCVGGRVALGWMGGWEGGSWMGVCVGGWPLGGWVGGWPLDGCVWWVGGPWMDELAMVCIVAELVGGS